MKRSVGDFMASVDRTVEEYGFNVISVFGDEEHGPFSYTVGFWQTHQHPEVIVTGISPQMAHTFMWILYDRIQEGAAFLAGERYGDICDGYDVEFREVPPPRRPLNTARAYYGGDFPALQMVFPDKDGNFPGEEGYSMEHQEIVTGDWE